MPDPPWSWALIQHPSRIRGTRQKNSEAAVADALQTWTEENITDYAEKEVHSPQTLHNKISGVFPQHELSTWTCFSSEEMSRELRLWASVDLKEQDWISSKKRNQTLLKGKNRTGLRPELWRTLRGHLDLSRCLYMGAFSKVLLPSQSTNSIKSLGTLGNALTLVFALIFRGDLTSGFPTES